MFEFRYNYVKLKCGEKAKLCYIYTDSFIVYIKTDNIYKYIPEDVVNRFKLQIVNQIDHCLKEK